MDNFTHCLQYIKVNKIKIYSDDGLYHLAKMDLFSLERPILEKILELYPKILQIDEITDFNPTITNNYGSPELLNIHEHVKEIKEKLNSLFKLLEEEKKKME